MEREGVFWDKADNTRIAGLSQLHNRLAFDARGVPMLYVFSTCRHFIRTLPALVYSQVDVEDVDTEGEDHIYDECRYVCMENHWSPPVERRGGAGGFDPLCTESSGFAPYAGRIRERKE